MAADDECSEKTSLARQILAARDGSAPMLANALNAAKPYLQPIGYVASLFIDYVGPFYVQSFQVGYRVYCRLPVDIISALGGLALAFFGGAYCASIAALEAVKMSGWESTKEALRVIYTDAVAVYEAHKKDEAAVEKLRALMKARRTHHRRPDLDPSACG